MTQQFKFGDRVKYKSLGECVVINSSEHFCYVMNEKGDYNTIANPEELELIPHPDTVRLDWLQSNVLVFSGEKIAIINDGLDFYLTDNPEKPELENPMKTLRQAIENAMQQEQTK